MAVVAAGAGVALVPRLALQSVARDDVAVIGVTGGGRRRIEVALPAAAHRGEVVGDFVAALARAARRPAKLASGERHGERIER